MPLFLFKTFLHFILIVVLFALVGGSFAVFSNKNVLLEIFNESTSDKLTVSSLLILSIVYEKIALM